MSYLKLVRLPLLALIALSQIFFHFFIARSIVAIPEYDMPTLQLVLIVCSTLFIAAGGFVINDYFDMRIDEINRPFTRIVGNEISRHEAMTFYIVLSAIGLICSLALGWMVSSMFMSFFFLTVFGLLWFYSSSYKRILVLGNLMVALAVALIPFVVALFEQRSILVWWGQQLALNGCAVDAENLSRADTTIFEVYSVIGTFSVLIFFWVVVLEIIRNLEEQNGEREMECHTLPIVYGDKIARCVAISIIVLINLFCIYSIAQNIELLKSVTISFYVCTSLAFSAALSYFVWVADHRRDYSKCRTLIYLILASIIAYSYVFSTLY